VRVPALAPGGLPEELKGVPTTQHKASHKLNVGRQHSVDVDGFTLVNGSTVAGKREQQQQREQRTHRLFRHPCRSFFAFWKRSAVRRGGRRKAGERIGRGQRAAGNGTCRVAVPFVYIMLTPSWRAAFAFGHGLQPCQDCARTAQTGTHRHEGACNGSRAAWGSGLGTLLPPTMR